MKKIMSLALALMFSGALFAQRSDYRQKDPQEIATRQSEHMKTTLDLSDEQFASVQNINLKFAERISQLRGDTTMAREVRQQKMSDLRNEQRAEIDAVLSAEQKAKREARQKSFSRDHRVNRGQRGDGNRNEALKSLSLSDEQSKKLDAAEESFRGKLQTIRNEQLTANQRKEKITSARQEHEQNVKSILSDEQFSKWKENKKGHPQKRLKQEHYYKK